MHIELVVFDMAGTTLHDDDAVGGCLRDALREHGVEVSAAEVDAVMGWSKPSAIRALLKRRGAPADDAMVARVHHRFRDRMLEHYATSPEVREVGGTSTTFRALHDAGVKVALDTGFDRSIADVVLRRTGWLAQGLVDAVVTSDEVARGRPFPDMIHEAMRRTSVRGSWRVAKVGDTPSDLQEGAAAGCCLIVGVTRGTHDEAQLRPYLHTHLIPTVAELPRVVARFNASPRVA